jgi:hypothetical protein
MKKFDEIKAIIAEAQGDVEKFYKNNNNAAGTRVRKAMQDIKVLAQDVRLEVQDMKNKETATK